MLPDQIYLRNSELNFPFAMHLRVCNMLFGYGGCRICSISQTHLTTEPFCQETRFSGIPIWETESATCYLSLCFLSEGNWKRNMWIDYKKMCVGPTLELARLPWSFQFLGTFEENATSLPRGTLCSYTWFPSVAPPLCALLAWKLPPNLEIPNRIESPSPSWDEGTHGRHGENICDRATQGASTWRPGHRDQGCVLPTSLRSTHFTQHIQKAH